jgi:hypothetical protein
MHLIASTLPCITARECMLCFIADTTKYAPKIKISRQESETWPQYFGFAVILYIMVSATSI